MEEIGPLMAFSAPLVGLSYQSIFHIELITQIPIMFSFKQIFHMEACSQSYFRLYTILTDIIRENGCVTIRTIQNLYVAMS